MASPQGPEPKGISAKSWPVRAVYGCCLLLLLSVVNAIFPEINLRTTPAVPWFPVPMLTIGICATFLCRHTCGSPLENPRTSPLALSAAFGLAVLSVLGLSAAGALLTGLEAIRLGHATLPGDLLPAPSEFRKIYSITVGITEALTEEASVRGIIQLPLSGRMGSPKAQIVANTAFVVAHLFTRSGWSEFAFLGVMAITCGLLASVSRNVWLPAVVHASTNTVVAVVVLCYRP